MSHSTSKHMNCFRSEGKLEEPPHHREKHTDWPEAVKDKMAEPI